MSILVLLLCMLGVNKAAVTTVHIVTMCHLDIGYAKLASTIINEYFDTYFPNAAITAQQLRDSGRTERLIFTSHSWLIDIYINCEKYAKLNALPPGPIHCPNATALQLVSSAIQKGDITWHAFPFNADIEFLMNPQYLAAAINTVHALDAQTGQTKKGTISQRDVPGTTRSIIPVLIQNGVQGLSVGVNEAVAPPAVPKIFKWLDPVSNASIIAMWHPHGYGGDTLTDCVTFENFTHALCWDFRTDNSGPPGIQEVIQTYQTVLSEFPGANATASTYDEFLKYALTIKDELPVVTGEIGNTWVYGYASDPLKNAITREVIRARTECVESNMCDPSTFEFHAFDVMFVKNTEHTWSLDTLIWLKDYSHYTHQQMIPVLNQSNFQIMVYSWVEQREFITQAINALGNSSFASELKERISVFGNPTIDLKGFIKADPNKQFSCGRYEIGFNASTGSINYFLDLSTKFNWASPSNPLAEFHYQTYSQDDYTTFFNEYMLEPIVEWISVDFGKPNMTNNHTEYLPVLENLYTMENSSKTQFYLQLQMPPVAVTENGAPLAVWIYISVPHDDSLVNITVIWQNKTFTRLAESLFVSFIPTWTSTTDYKFSKLGEWIRVTEVILNGSKHLHNLQEGVQYTNEIASLQISSIDASLVCIGNPTAFPTPLIPFADPSKGSHFILYDNVWGTNFILWYPYLEEDYQQSFRFQLNFNT